jgi:putative tricarboxylic transport membrane protein
VKILKIPTPQLYAGILVFATIGSYGVSNSVVDLLVMYGVGIVGLFMKRYDFPVAPAVIGMILGPLAEQAFRQALTISQGDYTTFLTRPISASFLAIAFLLGLGPKLWNAWAASRARAA